MTVQRKLFAWLITIVIAILIGASIAAWLMRPAPVIETPAPEQTQADGSRIIERRPDPTSKPKHQTPKGSKVERVIHLEAQGQGIRQPSGETQPCPPVAIDLSLVREADGGKRVVASSPNGEILSALDVPVETAAPPPEPHHWAAGVSYNPIHQTAGLWLERDLGRVRAGVELNQVRQHIASQMTGELRVRVGWVF